MIIVTVASSKGGVGKSTLASALAVRASMDGKRVALIDADLQGSLKFWWHARGEPDNPQLREVDCTAEGLALVAAEGWDWVFIDTPPALVEDIQQAVSVADFVLMPARPSALDLMAIGTSVQICAECEKPYAFVLNQADAKWQLSASAAKELASYGPMLATVISFRLAYAAAATRGRSGPEVERGNACAAEIDALWVELNAHIRKAVRRT